jgi:hypothetical protein
MGALTNRSKQEVEAEDDYEKLLRNPDAIDLKFEIRGGTVVKRASDRTVIVVGRKNANVAL